MTDKVKYYSEKNRWRRLARRSDATREARTKRQRLVSNGAFGRTSKSQFEELAVGTRGAGNGKDH